MTASTPTPEPARAEPVGGAFQARVKPWVVACFGDEVACDVLERQDRFVEEALELVQSLGYDRGRVAALIDYVFDREPGETRQEIGGTMMTLAALCNAIGQDMHAAGEAELARVWTKVDAIRAKQATKPKGSALPVAPAPAPDAGLAEVAATVADYEAVLADKRRLTRELDVAMHGERGAAAQASLCDLIEPARKMSADLDDARANLALANEELFFLRAGAEDDRATIAALRADNDRLRADAAGRGKGVSLPDGYALVPREPTPKMRRAFHDAHERWENGGFESPDHQWSSMLTAAPAPATDGTGGQSDGV